MRFFPAAACVLALGCSSTDTVTTPSGGAPGASGARGGTTADMPAGDPATPTAAVVLDLGEVEAGQDVSFEVPAGAIGFNVTVEGDVGDFDEAAPFGVERITDPDGNVVHDRFTPRGGDHPTSLAAFDTLASVSVPQGEGVPERLGGRWTLRVGQENRPTSRIKTHVVVRIQSTGDGAFHGGKLDLHVHVPIGLRVSGETIRSDTDLAASAGLKDRIDTYFKVTTRLLGIERGAVVFHSAPSSLASLDGLAAIVAGFRVSRGTKDGTQAFHILFTNEIADEGEPFAAGIAPGVPGAANVFGRNVSGIIVATSPHADDDIATMIHETGHFFGLNHTTELDGRNADPLSDTPKCSTIADKQLQSCPDKTNIMFAAGAIAGPVTLTPSQKRIYRGSPVYRAYPAGTARTQARRDLTAEPLGPLAGLARTFRRSGKALSPLESELSAGICGLTRIDARDMVRRHGGEPAVAALRAAAADDDLSPILRGRARLALRDLARP